jgi:hypothetical protein
MNRKALGFCALALIGALGFSAAPAMAGPSYGDSYRSDRYVTPRASVTIRLGDRGYRDRHVVHRHSRDSRRDCCERDNRRDRGRHHGWSKNRRRGC